MLTYSLKLYLQVLFTMKVDHAQLITSIWNIMHKRLRTCRMVMLHSPSSR